MEVKGSSVKWVILVFLTNLILIAVNPVSGQVGTTLKPQADLPDTGLTIEYLPFDDTLTDRTTDGDKTTWTGAKSIVNYYELPPTEQYEGGGHEYEVVLTEKPTTNIFNFKLGMGDLAFYYQPPLTDEINIKGWTVNETHALDDKGRLATYRPENVVGSYAVYNRNDFKIMHIYRPKILDAKQNEVWGQLSIIGDALTVTVPQDFLNTAVYPVIIDPTFGYTSIGGSQDNNPWGNVKVAWRVLNQVGDGNISSISVYGRAVDTTGAMRTAIYATNVITPYAPSTLIAESNEVNITTTAQWWNFTINAYVWNNTYYYLSIIRKPGFNNFRNYYDAGTYLQAVQEADTYADGFSDPFDNGLDFNFSRKGSAYANATANPRTITEVVNVSSIWTYYDPSSVAVNTGTLDDGTIANITQV
jgi:hypothetical protein